MIFKYIVIECYPILFRKLCPDIGMVNRNRRAILVLLQILVYVNDKLTHLDRIIVVSLLPGNGWGLVPDQYRSSRRISLWHVGNGKERFSLTVRV